MDVVLTDFHSAALFVIDNVARLAISGELVVDGAE